jgi:hypothetical protein
MGRRAPATTRVGHSTLGGGKACADMCYFAFDLLATYWSWMAWTSRALHAVAGDRLLP